MRDRHGVPRFIRDAARTAARTRAWRGLQNVLTWGRFQTARDAIDAAFKIVTAVAAFGALQLFALRPDIETSLSCVDEIDREAVLDAYVAAGLDAPDIVLPFGDWWNTSALTAPNEDYLRLSSELGPGCPGDPRNGDFFWRTLSAENLPFGSFSLSPADLYTAREMLANGRRLTIVLTWPMWGEEE
jgi:hypothetical protein